MEGWKIRSNSQKTEWLINHILGIWRKYNKIEGRSINGYYLAKCGKAGWNKVIPKCITSRTWAWDVPGCFSALSGNGDVADGTVIFLVLVLSRVRIQMSDIKKFQAEGGLLSKAKELSGEGERAGCLRLETAAVRAGLRGLESSPAPQATSLDG